MMCDFKKGSIPPRKKGKGFTLTELLIALAILGVIATFTIPKIIGAQQNQKTKSIIQEDAAILSQLIYTASISGIDIHNTYSYFLQKINYTSVTGNSSGWIFTLSNGSTITGSDTAYDAPSYTVDVDGNAGANQLGNDRITLRYGLAVNGYYPCRPGKFTAVNGDASVSLYTNIFGQPEYWNP